MLLCASQVTDHEDAMPPNADDPTRQSLSLTDESLSAERAKVDGELAARIEAQKEDADAVIKLARKRAEAVLRLARTRADDAMAQQDPEQHEQVVQERVQADRVRVAEQAASDATLQAERQLRRQMMAELLASERDATDTALLHERERTDQSLQQREDLFAMVNHDFLGLVSAVVLNASAIIADADEQDVRGRRIIGRAEAIHRATLRMEQVVNSLLDVAAIESGMLHVKLQAADAALVVRESTRLFEPVAAAKGLRLEADLEAEPLRGLFDPPRITQVLENLLTNAIKFTPAPGVVSVRATRTGSEIELAVSDSGRGIPADQLPTIFERFGRARGTRVAGHGLGLYICRQLVAAHDGEITVESELGRGTTFKFHIRAEPHDGPGAATP
jgi:signal transduction histidine kinase